MVDALKDLEFKGGGLFLKINSGEPVTLRVLTLDPVVSTDQWGGTKYAFTVWNWNENKAQIWQTTPGNLKKLTSIHRDEDFDPLNKLDVKVTATGEMLEKRYEIVPLPKAKELTNAMVKEARTINLDEKIEGGSRLSAYEESDGEEVSGYEKAKATAARLREDMPQEPADPENVMEEDVVIDDIGDEPISLDDIPF